MSLLHSTIRGSKALRHASLTCSRCPQIKQRLASDTSAGSHTGKDWEGRKGDEHVINRGDELDVQSGAAQSGARERASGEPQQSQATTEGDARNQNEQAKKDHPEAPGPVIGMNDERGQAS
ncbi:hypothetical protein MMC21_000201 [Puttea exsequens]|nr:hypothetical protein [Puttea exsequens]